MPERIDGGQALVAIGAIALIVSLFLSWYEPGRSAWTVFEVWDIVLAAIGIAALASIVPARRTDVRDEHVVPERWLPALAGASLGMATARLARDEELARDVAVKVLSDVLGEDPSYVARFRREARVAARVSHPHLVRMFDYAGEAERPYIVMEYIGGGTLADRIRAGTAEEVDPERLARQLLGALGAIHAAGVVHRDVKPSNVLLDSVGDVHLTDFGIAQPEDATQLTGTGHVIGTLKYMAPEVLAGGPATERSDLFALGVVLQEALAGREA